MNDTPMGFRRPIRALGCAAYGGVVRGAGEATLMARAHDNALDAIDHAREAAPEKGQPHVVVWVPGRKNKLYLTMPAHEYRSDHGCVERVYYPRGYEHPVKPGEKGALW